MTLEWHLESLAAMLNTLATFLEQIHDSQVPKSMQLQAYQTCLATLDYAAASIHEKRAYVEKRMHEVVD